MKRKYSRLEEAKKILGDALEKATKAVQIAKEELTKPLAHQEREERDTEELCG